MALEKMPADQPCFKCNGTLMTKKGKACKKCNGTGKMNPLLMSEDLAQIYNDEVKLFC